MIFSVDSTTPCTINPSGLKPQDLVTAIQNLKPTVKWFSQYSGLITLEASVTVDQLRFWFEWKVPPTDELVAQLDEPARKEYECWEAAKAADQVLANLDAEEASE